ncbi:peptidylprolyl isomerase [Candidatus Sumerlaeota bacterium]|nr:peptidylprolyl isomerase [Candidatus Sumerlaeota bacterium]
MDFTIQAQPASPPPITSDAIIARVNGKPVLLSQIKEAALDLDLPVSSLTSEGLRGEGFRRAVTALVDEELLVQAAQKAEIPSDETELARRVDGMMRLLIERMGGEAAFDTFLKKSNLNLDSLRRTVLEREKRQDLAAAVVARRVKLNNAEVEEYRRKKDEAGEKSEEVNLAQILVLCPKSEQDTPAGKKLRQKALDAARQAGKDRTKFAELARKLSDDAATRERGGMLGWVDPKSLQEPLRKRVAEMSVNDISEPVATDLGFHVLFLMDRHSPHELLFAERFSAERTKLLESLRAEATIEIYPLR